MTSDPPFVECEQMHAGLAVSEIPASVDFYTKNLGFTLAFTWGDPPTFAGMNLGKVQTFLQHGTSDPKGCTSSSAMRTNSTNFIAPTALKSRRRMATEHTESETTSCGI